MDRILIGFLLIYFIINYDWSKTKVKKWMPYIFILILSFYIIHYFLLLFDVDTIAMIKEQKVVETILSKINQKKPD